MRVMFDAFWWGRGPGANRTVQREFIRTWAESFPGDELVLTNPLTEGTKTIGKLRARCTATANADAAKQDAFIQAHFICEGVFSLPGGTLYGNASIVKGGTEGVVTGGTGKYAGARGTIDSKEVKGGSTTTITERARRRGPGRRQGRSSTPGGTRAGRRARAWSRSRSR